MGVMVYRQLKRFTRARSRVIGSIFNPLIWMVFFGLGWSGLFTSSMAKLLFRGLDYMSFLAPGMVMMAIFTASLFSGMSVIWDREFGFLKELLVAPASRTAIILGRSIGDALTALAQGVVILAASFLLAKQLTPTGIPLAVAIGLLAAIAFTSMGIALASTMRSFEGFNLITTFLMLPLLFLSGAFYPIDSLPLWLKALVYLNPLTYAVDATRYALTGVSSFNILHSTAALALSAVILTLAATYTFKKSTIE
ncbi:MAG: ABC transporter permease [Candidatus Verstraetearchaeota archaeon]|nr:ABC transporter permease [Candidatus Verstraetearchaeota archaeon]